MATAADTSAETEEAISRPASDWHLVRVELVPVRFAGQGSRSAEVTLDGMGVVVLKLVVCSPLG